LNGEPHPDRNRGEEQLRTFAKWLLLVPLVMLLVFGCSQLALITGGRLNLAAMASRAAKGYGPWDYLPLRALRRDILAQLRLDKGAEASSLDESAGGGLGEWLAQGESPAAPAPTAGGGHNPPPPTSGPTAADAPTETPSSSSVPTNTPTPTDTPYAPPSATPTPTPTPDSGPPPQPTATSTPTSDEGSGLEWWDGQYAYRKQVAVNTSSKGVPVGYTVALTIGHADLVSQGKAQADGRDVRIVWHGPAGPVELDRVLDDDSAWEGSTTILHFALQEALGPNSEDGRYYLYYGNPQAGAAPADPNRVYWYASTFDSEAALLDWTTYDVEQWTNWKIKGGKLVQYRNAKQDDQLPYINGKLLLTARGQIRDLAVELDFKVGDNDLLAVGLCSADNKPQGFYVAISQDRWFDDDDGPDRVGYWIGESKTGWKEISYSEDQWYPLKVAWTDGSIAALGYQYVAAWDVGPPQASYFCLALNGLEGVSIDNLTIRHYVDPEPTLSLGSEETSP